MIEFTIIGNVNQILFKKLIRNHGFVDFELKPDTKGKKDLICIDNSQELREALKAGIVRIGVKDKEGDEFIGIAKNKIKN